jgi:hypothetical protein
VTAVLIVEAIDTASDILDAILMWIVAAAFVATVALFTTVLAVAQGLKTVRRGLSWRRNAPQGNGEGFPAPAVPDAPQARAAPQWAREPHGHQEAA